MTKWDPISPPASRSCIGGSVKAANCVELAVKPDVDGFLVEGAFLEPQVARIVQSATDSK
jgi:triosephosphate isomerase